MRWSMAMRRDRGFSRIELILIATILALIGLIAIPRLSRGDTGPADATLVGNLAVLRNAIDLYVADHGGRYPQAKDLARQLTHFTDATGDIGNVEDNRHIYGPYLRALPPLPIGFYRGATYIIDGHRAAPGESAGGWWYLSRTGTIKPNVKITDLDDRGQSYLQY